MKTYIVATEVYSRYGDGYEETKLDLFQAENLDVLAKLLEPEKLR